jgi:hypothetical protein
MWSLNKVSYGRKNEGLWEVYVKDVVGHSFEVEAYSEYWAVERIKEKMLLKGLDSKKFDFSRNDGGVY